MRSFAPKSYAVVIGASGGIGAALVKALLDQSTFTTVVALARSFEDDLKRTARFQHGSIDIANATYRMIDAAGCSKATEITR
jgi:uncharacterized protein YbjT (DUF2867 family)